MSLLRRSRIFRFSTILPSGEKAERELSAVEREFSHVKESQFSKLGLYRKNKTNVSTLYKLFQLAQPRNKTDYSACVYSMNHFYNFGVSFEHYDFANRWLALAVETSRVDEAMEIVKTWHTWLAHPPRLELVNVLIGMVKPKQAVELLKAVRENWQMPLSSTTYSVVIGKLLGNTQTDPESLESAYICWKDAVSMDVALSGPCHELVERAMKSCGRSDDAAKVRLVAQNQIAGGF